VKAHPSVLRRWWLDRSVRTKGMIVVAVPLLALMATVAASLTLQASERQVRQVARAASAISTSASQVLADAVDAETGVRGYAATGDPLFLQSYNAALARLAGDRSALRAAAVAERTQPAERVVNATVSAVFAHLDAIRAAVAARTGHASLQSMLGAGKQSTDLLRRQTAALAADPAAVVASNRRAITQMESAIETLDIAGLALGVVAAVACAALFTSGIASRVRAAGANADRLGAGQPLVPLPSAGDEIGRLIAALVAAEALLARRTREITSARDEALRATQAKNAFLSSTSHELRTPLNAVLGFTQLLQLSDLSEEDQQAVERIMAAGRHLLELINELIDIARIESGKFSLSVEPVLVAPVVEETCLLMGPLAAARSITLRQHGGRPWLAVRADRQRLRQILVNLVSNAIKYNHEGGTVTLSYEPDGDGQAVIDVADTGPGIGPGDLEHIFTAFERLDADQSGIEGTGIGLSLARAFAQAMCGQLTVASVVGEGATFSLTLPRTADMRPAGPASAPLPAQRVAVGTPRTSVLYIEDNPANVEVVARFVRSRPRIELRTATSGAEGLDLAAQRVPDLILLDLHLPGMSGRDVLRELRARSATADVPVAVLSADASPDVIREMRVRGVVTYLTKPLDLAELGQLLDGFTDWRRPAEPAEPGEPGDLAGDATTATWEPR
jgi:signal transduction histidine kinase/CheY-like chemotaxis protein